MRKWIWGLALVGLGLLMNEAAWQLLIYLAALAVVGLVAVGTVMWAIRSIRKGTGGD